MPPNTLIPLKEWLDRTSLIGRTRSDALKRLDAAIGAYDKSPTSGAKMAVIAAFEAWKLESGGESAWRASPRNQSKPVGAFTRLQALLAGDSDAAFGIANAGQQAHHRQARLGVLYLYSQMSVSTNVFGMLFDTAGGLASGAFNFNLSATKMLDSDVNSLSGVGKLGAQGGQKLLGAIEKRAEMALGNAVSWVSCLAPKIPESEVDRHHQDRSEDRAGRLGVVQGVCPEHQRTHWSRNSDRCRRTPR